MNEGKINMMREIYDLRMFTLIFKDQNLLEDFKDMVSMFNKTEQQIKVEDIGRNTYEVSPLEGHDTCWEIVMHKYLSYSKNIKSASGENYYPVIMTTMRLMNMNEKAV